MNSPEAMGLIGTYRFRKAKLQTRWQFAVNDMIVLTRNIGMHRVAGRLIEYLNSICEVETTYHKNLLPTVGRAAIMDHLTNASPSPSTLRVNYVSLGSNTTTPANADTQLGTETYRNAVASATKSNNIGYITGFFSATETSGTYRECGLHIAGTASANSGTLFSHVAINITKTTSETLTIDWTVTLT